MSEDERPGEAEVREALGRFLDRLARAVAEVLARPEPGARPPRRRAPKPPADETR